MTPTLTGIRKWRAPDNHTGIDVVEGVRYTYRHADGRDLPRARAEVYRVETVILYSPQTPFHLNVYFVPGDVLDLFFESWGEHAEQVIDIRPTTTAEACAELRAFKKTHARKGLHR